MSQGCKLLIIKAEPALKHGCKRSFRETTNAHSLIDETESCSMFMLLFSRVNATYNTSPPGISGTDRP
jgi:hypothetical protein